MSSVVDEEYNEESYNEEDKADEDYRERACGSGLLAVVLGCFGGLLGCGGRPGRFLALCCVGIGYRRLRIAYGRLCIAYGRIRFGDGRLGGNGGKVTVDADVHSCALASERNRYRCIISGDVVGGEDSAF